MEHDFDGLRVEGIGCAVEAIQNVLDTLEAKSVGDHLFGAYPSL